MVVNFEHLHWFESDQEQTRIFKLPDGVHLVSLHHYLLLTVNLQHRQVFLPRFMTSSCVLHNDWSSIFH